MRKYIVADVSERQLEDLVRQAPDLIEAGLRFVDHQAFTTNSEADLEIVRPLPQANFNRFTGR
jgi:RecB family endonuclease NucS